MEISNAVVGVHKTLALGQVGTIGRDAREQRRRAETEAEHRVQVDDAAEDALRGWRRCAWTADQIATAPADQGVDLGA